MDLRAGAPAAERRTRSRSLRGPILARTASSRTDDDDRLRLPTISPTQNGKAGKKKSTARRLNRHCPQHAKPSSNSSPGYRQKDVRTAENGFAAKSSVSKSAKVVLGHEPINGILRNLENSDFNLLNREALMARFHLTDFEWSVIQPLLPNKPRGVPRVDDRRVLNGIFWRLRTGAPWPTSQSAMGRIRLA